MYHYVSIGDIVAAAFDQMDERSIEIKRLVKYGEAVAKILRETEDPYQFMVSKDAWVDFIMSNEDTFFVDDSDCKNPRLTIKNRLGIDRVFESFSGAIPLRTWNALLCPEALNVLK